MKTGNLRKLIILVVMISMASLFACSATRDVYDVSKLAAHSVSNLILPEGKPVLKKKILVAPVINKAEITASQAEKIRQQCISYLSKDEYLAITILKQWSDTVPSSVMKQYGAVINPEYLKTAEKLGMNVLLTCVIHPLEVSEKRTGIWPFRNDSHNVLISISLNALDTLNGTFIAYETETEHISIKKIGSGESGKWTPDYNMLADKIASITKKLCSSVIEKLNKQPWQNKVIIDGDNLVINAGKDIGINKNTVFELFKKGDPIKSFSGEEYYLLGTKIGESRVKSISKDRTVLAVNANGDYRESVFVRVKRAE